MHVRDVDRDGNWSHGIPMLFLLGIPVIFAAEFPMSFMSPPSLALAKEPLASASRHECRIKIATQMGMCHSPRYKFRRVDNPALTKTRIPLECGPSPSGWLSIGLGFGPDRNIQCALHSRALQMPGFPGARPPAKHLALMAPGQEKGCPTGQGTEAAYSCMLLRFGNVLVLVFVIFCALPKTMAVCCYVHLTMAGLNQNPPHQLPLRSLFPTYFWLLHHLLQSQLWLGHSAFWSA